MTDPVFLYFHVKPRYTSGSPAMVERPIAERIAREESDAYMAALQGDHGETKKLKAEEEGRMGIVEERWERDGQTHFRDLITDARGVRDTIESRGDKRELTDAEVFTLTNALRRAAETFIECAGVMHLEKQPRLAEQFERQVTEARVLADLIEDFGGVTLHIQPDEDEHINEDKEP